jgi:uncharacterized damage-inducible protein DinB
VRVDTAQYAEGVVPPYYDSLIAKLIVHGVDRAEAIAKMERALSQFVVQGIETSIPLHQEIFAMPGSAPASSTPSSWSGFWLWATWRLPQMDAQKELIAEFDREAANTRKMLDAIPADADFNFKPHPKSMSLGRLAGHLTDFSGEWALSTLTKDKIEFSPDSNWKPFVPTSKAERWRSLTRSLWERARRWWRRPATRGTGTGSLYGRARPGSTQPKHQVFRDSVLNHMIHHRGQLTVYLRLLDAKVPGTYGPSADEM